jgi:hypothetical protein
MGASIIDLDYPHYRIKSAAKANKTDLFLWVGKDFL